MPLLMPNNRNPAPTYDFSATAEMFQKFQHCELVAAATAVGDWYANKGSAGPVRVKVNTALPAAVNSVRMLRDVKHLLEEKEINLTGIRRLPIIFGSAIL